METIRNLGPFVKDDYRPKPKEIPELNKKTIKIDMEYIFCPFCGHPLEYHYKSNKRTLITLNYEIELYVIHRKCVNEECQACIAGRNFYNHSLDLYALPKRRFALDVCFLIGYLIHEENFTEEEVVEYLLKEHGISICQASVSNYNKICLALSETILADNPSKIRKGLNKLPFKIYTIDGLSSNKSRTLFVVRELITGVILGTALLDNHDADSMHEFMEKIFQAFGKPKGMVGDGETGLMAAIRKYYDDILYHYCHRHFLDNLGGDLMEDLNQKAKKNSIERMH